MHIYIYIYIHICIGVCRRRATHHMLALLGEQVINHANEDADIVRHQFAHVEVAQSAQQHTLLR